MTDLRSQRRLAAQILKIGQNRIWIDPEKIEDADAAITREEIRKLIHEGVIKQLPEKGVSRARARILHAKKKRGLRSGPGSRTGSPRARVSKKEAWTSKIRALRNKLQKLKTNKTITENAYRKMYKMASSGRFESVADLERYLKSHELWRKR
ncbi:MAG TPA: 50S ribosomal protein L19e [Candidatus Bathyarchaeia archaeon]|jgi:large subunit ribosomal protein L19e|nr:50S ribosomal protein L19e [Candidatus Bathyarchaeia archaeon]